MGSRVGTTRLAVAIPALAGLWVACAQLGLGPAAAPVDIGFAGPGRLLVVFELADGRSALWIFDAEGARELPVAAVREARFATPDRIVAVVEVPAREEFRLAGTRLARVDVTSGALEPFGEEGRHYDAEPSPDGAFLLVGAEVAGVGDSNLEVWSIEEVPELVTFRAQSLEEPRWRQDGLAIVASVVMGDPETDAATGGGFEQRAFTWPRLHRLRRDLGHPELLFDGAERETFAPGGSLALWWDARGLFARQRGGLVRCEIEADRCTGVYAPGGERRIVDGRRVGETEAWLTSVALTRVGMGDDFDAREPDRIHRVDLQTGAVTDTELPRGLGVVDLDWIADPPAELSRTSHGAGRR